MRSAAGVGLAVVVEFAAAAVDSWVMSLLSVSLASMRNDLSDARLLIERFNSPGGMLMEDALLAVGVDGVVACTCLKWQCGLGQATREKNGHGISRK